MFVCLCVLERSGKKSTNVETKVAQNQMMTQECQHSSIFHFICGFFGPVNALIEFSMLGMKSFFTILVRFGKQKRKINFLAEVPILGDVRTKKGLLF